MRLRLAMDAWCAMWFWPMTGSTEDSNDEGKNPPGPPSLDEWILTFEELLGFDGVRRGHENQAMFHETVDSFGQLAEMDDLERDFYGMSPVWKLVLKHQWLGIARGIAAEQGFFHWKLDFAQIFQRGGFDLQVGNPPWVRPKWRDDLTLAEFDPYFMLQAKIPDKEFDSRRRDLLEQKRNQVRYLNELTIWAGTSECLSSPVDHPALRGVQTNLYTNFMEKVWRNMSANGVTGLIHPESHFSDPSAGVLRAEAYSRLRRHFQFFNELTLFEGVGGMAVFGLHVYRQPNEIRFVQMTSLCDPATIDGSFQHDGQGEVPGIQFPWGGRDTRPHGSRLVSVTSVELQQWAGLFDEPGTQAAQARLLRPLTIDEVDGLSVLASYPERMRDLGYKWTRCFEEDKGKRAGHIEWRTENPSSWEDVVLQGPHFTVSTPYARQPNINCRSKFDYTTWDLETLPELLIPRTNYQRACSREEYDSALPKWDDRPASDYWRVAWRRMTQPGLERSLHAAIIPPGVAHIDNVNSCAVVPGDVHNAGLRQLSVDPSDARNTAVVAGLWASLPFDYLVKVSGTSKVNAELIGRFPAPVNHIASSYLLLRVLRLNCLTRDYAPLWQGLFEEAFKGDRWTSIFSALPSMGVVERNWTINTPIRSEFERRAALVEIDALVALMLGLSADQLALMFRAQFPVLRKYEYEMYFDRRGRKIAKDHQTHGVRQQKDDYKLLQAFFEGEDCGDLLTRYTPFPADENHDKPWFYKPNREAEMRAAYAEFERRLGLSE